MLNLENGMRGVPVGGYDIYYEFSEDSNEWRPRIADDIGDREMTLKQVKDSFRATFDTTVRFKISMSRISVRIGDEWKHLACRSDDGWSLTNVSWGA